MRILVVEDDAFMRKALIAYLGKVPGYVVSQAFTVDGALAILRQEPAFDVVLLDIQLDHQSGWSVVSHIKSDEKHSATPVIVISGLDTAAIHQGAMNYGGLLARTSIIMGKPVDGDKLLEMIRRVTGT